jgi:tellurite resistance protein
MDIQDKAILKGLVAVAWVDGVLHEGEHEHIEALINAFGANEEEAEEIRAFAKTPKTLLDIPITDLSRDDRRVLLNHAVVLTYMDGEQTDDERKMIGELREVLRIPEGEAQRVIDAATARAQRLLQMTG